MAELEKLHLRLAVAVQVITAAGAAAMEATAATQAPPEAVAEAAMAVTAVTAPEAAAVTAAMAAAVPAAEAVVEAAMALEVMEVTAPKVGHRLPLEDLPLVAVVVPLFLEVLPEIFRRQAAPAFALSNTTFMR